MSDEGEQKEAGRVTLRIGRPDGPEGPYARIELDAGGETITRDISTLDDLLDELEGAGVKVIRSTHDAPPLVSIVPQDAVSPISKVARATFERFTGDDLAVTVATGPESKPMSAELVVTSELPDGGAVRLSKALSPFDRCVADAVTSIYAAGNSVFTPAQVVRMMAGMRDTETPSPQQVDAVRESIDRMRFTRVDIDASDEFAARRIACSARFSSYVLAADEVEVTTGGRIESAYRVLREPILYSYSRHVRQVLTVPARLHAITDASGARVSTTERRTVIRAYLMRRIGAMKGKAGKRMSRHIDVDTIMREAGVKLDDKKARKAVRDYAETCLDYWTREGWIEGFSAVMEGRTIHAYAVRV